MSPFKISLFSRIGSSVLSAIGAIGGAVSEIIGEYFYDFNQQTTDGFVGAGEGEVIINDYLTGSGGVSSLNYFYTEALSPSGNTTITKFETTFYTPVEVPVNSATDNIRHVLFEGKAATGQYILLGNAIGLVTTEIIVLATGNNIWYITNAQVSSITVGTHTLVIEWNSVDNRYDFTYDGTTYPGTQFLNGDNTDPFIINNKAFNIMRRSDASSSIPHPDGAYTAILKFYDAADNVVLDFKNIYGANGTTYDYGGTTFTRVVGNTAKRVTISTPGEYRLENSSENKPSFILGNALKFDGVNDYVTLTGSSAISLTEVSVNMWLNLTNWGGAGQEFISRFSGSATNGLFKIGNSSGGLLQPFFPTTSGVANLSYNTSALTGWHMITVTFKQSFLYLYIDGNEVASSLTVTGTFLSSGVDFRIGARLNNTFYTNGIMDEIAIWNSILTPTQILSLYNSRNGDFATNYSPANLQAYFRCNEADGATTLLDENSTYNGTLTNFNFDGTDGFVRHGYYKELSPYTGIAGGFNGTAYITPNDSSVLNFGNEAVTFYAETTYYFNDAYEGIMGKWNMGTNNASYIIRKSNTNALQVIISNDGTTLSKVCNTTKSLVVGEYYKIAVVYDLSNVRISINGEAFEDFPYTDGFYNSSTADFALATGDNLNNKSTGTLSNALIIKDALSLAQVAQISNNPEFTKTYLVNTVGITWADVVAWYPLTENGGTTAYDYSDNANHGTWTNAAYVTGLSEGRQLSLKGFSKYVDFTTDTVYSSISNLSGVRNNSFTTVVGYFRINDNSVGFGNALFYFNNGSMGSTTSQNGIYLLTNANGNHIGFNTWNGDVYGVNGSVFNANVSEGFHIAAVFDNSATGTSWNNSKLYINGVLQSLSQLISTKAARTISDNFSIARSGGGMDTGAQIGDFIFRDLAVFDRELSESEVITSMTNLDSLSPFAKYENQITGGVLVESVIGANPTLTGTPETIIIPEKETISDIPYDVFGVECNFQNIQGTEQVLNLNVPNGYVEYDGHAGSYTDIKQIQFMIKPTSSNHAYVLTDEENNRVAYISDNQIVSDFGLSSVYINDIEAYLVLTDVWQQVTIEFTVPIDIEKLFIGSSAVPDAFEEFGFDKLNIVKDAVGWQDVLWDTLSTGISAIGSALTAASLSPSYANGASFDTPLTGDFTIEFKITMGTYSYIGLDKEVGVITAYDAGPPISGIDFSFRVDAASISLTNDGVSSGAVTMSNSDILKFVRVSGTIKLYKNDVLVYTYPSTYNDALYMKANRYSGSMTNYIYDAKYYLQ